MKTTRLRVWLAGGAALLLAFVYTMNPTPTNIHLDMNIFLTKCGYVFMLLSLCFKNDE